MVPLSVRSLTPQRSSGTKLGRQGRGGKRARKHRTSRGRSRCPRTGSSSTHADSGIAPSSATGKRCDAYQCGPLQARFWLAVRDSQAIRVCPNRAGQSSTHQSATRQGESLHFWLCTTTTQKARLIASVYLCSSTTIRLPPQILRLTNEQQLTLDLFDCRPPTLCSETSLLRASVLLKYPLLLPSSWFLALAATTHWTFTTSFAQRTRTSRSSAVTNFTQNWLVVIFW